MFVKNVQKVKICHDCNNGLRELAPKILVQGVNRNIRPFWISVDAQPDFMTRTLKCETLNEPEKRSFKQFNILHFNIPHLGNCNMSNLRHTVYFKAKNITVS